ncbi:hypothetical protein ACFL4G_12185, partial [Thermodesulfobacteriota bacterium]
ILGFTDWLFYSRTFHIPFHFDDWFYLYNAQWFDPIKEILKPVWYYNLTLDFYYLLMHRLFGLDPFGYWLAAHTLLVAACLVLALLIREWTGSYIIGLLAALLLITGKPLVNIITNLWHVFWIQGLFFMLLSMLFLEFNVQRSFRPSPYIRLFQITFILAFISLPIILMIIPAMLWMITARRASVRLRVGAVFPILLAMVFYLVIIAGQLYDELIIASTGTSIFGPDAYEAFINSMRIYKNAFFGEANLILESLFLMGILFALLFPGARIAIPVAVFIAVLSFTPFLFSHLGKIEDHYMLIPSVGISIILAICFHFILRGLFAVADLSFKAARKSLRGIMTQIRCRSYPLQFSAESVRSRKTAQLIMNGVALSIAITMVSVFLLNRYMANIEPLEGSVISIQAESAFLKSMVEFCETTEVENVFIFELADSACVFEPYVKDVNLARKIYGHRRDLKIPVKKIFKIHFKIPGEKMKYKRLTEDLIWTVSEAMRSKYQYIMEEELYLSLYKDPRNLFLSFDPRSLKFEDVGRRPYSELKSLLFSLSKNDEMDGDDLNRGRSAG